MKRTWLGMVGVLGVTLGFCGCGGDDDGGGTPGNAHNDTATTAITVGGSVMPKGTGVEGFFFVQNQNGDAVEVFSSEVKIAESTDGATWQPVTFAFDNGKQAGGARKSSFAASVAMTMDYSGSMNTPDTTIPDMETAVSTFVGLMGANDAAEIVKFSDTVQVMQSFTTDKTALQNAIAASFSGAGGFTALYDSIMQAVTDTAGQNAPWAVLALTDGGENASSTDRATMIAAATSHGIPVFTLGLGGSIQESDLTGIAQSTGGFYYKAPTSADLLDIYQKISGILNQSFKCTWTPTLSGTVQCKVTITYQTALGTFTAERVFTYTL